MKQAVDRRLTEDEQEPVQGLSSHIEVSPSSAVVTYSWGDFKHDPEDVLVRYFDAHLYLANWGSHKNIHYRSLHCSIHSLLLMLDFDAPRCKLFYCHLMKAEKALFSHLKPYITIL
ncbi:MAG: hypothetical protein PHP98_03745 [Kiritimatiellae bacterium]|nr:hypothetical protein [Kiritimatiellia bacterium]